MSGSGGGGYSGGGGSDNCAMLIFTTILSSPQPEVVAEIKEDEVLSIEADSVTGPARARTSGGATAGSINAGQLLSLLKCIESGYRYVGIVKTVKKGQVEIQVRPAPTK